MLFDLVTLTFELDLDILTLDLYAKIHVCMSVHSAVRVVTDRHTDYVKTITCISVVSQMSGVKKISIDGVF